MEAVEKEDVVIIKEQAACFTGHREIPLLQQLPLKKKLRRTIISSIEEGYRFFGAGGALGFDTLAAKTVLDLKKDYPDIKLILVLPCLNQTRGWKEKDIETYENIKSQADKVVYTSEQYFRGCMQKRNRHLVDNSTLCISYLTGETGGTAYTVNYARSKGLKILNLAEDTVK